jgi:predicted MPP superfamily phosphohydrolase
MAKSEKTSQFLNLKIKSIMNKKNVIFIISLLGLLVILYSYFIETSWIETTNHQISLNSNSSKKIKVIQISDLHTTGLGQIEEKFLKIINSLKPDYIFITGDIATPGGTSAKYEDVLKKIKAKRNVFYIPGNWEDWEPIPDLQNILKRNGIVDLTNKTIKLDENLWLVGFADAPTGSPDIKIIENIPKNSKIISIFHSPIFFKEVSNLIDLAFVGHTHGGQIRLPFIGAIALPPGSANFDQGWFRKNRAQMYVNRGIGTSIVPLRFMCRPEISVFEIKF